MSRQAPTARTASRWSFWRAAFLRGSRPPGEDGGVHDAPLIGITGDVAGERIALRSTYVDAVVRAGGTPIVLAPFDGPVDGAIARLDGVVLTGGDDPDMSAWGVGTHPKARRMDPRRQRFELALLAALEARPDLPLLGICLGMQLLALHAGGALDQHLPDTLSTAADHWGDRLHRVDGPLGAGLVTSHHRQAVSDPGRLRVVARASDGVIEAVSDPCRAFGLGVQWHPERTSATDLGQSLFDRLVDAARAVNPMAPPSR